MNNIVNLKDGFITFNSNIDYSLSFSKCGIGYSNYNINSHERGSLVFLTNNNANTTNISLHSDIRMCIASDGNVGIGTNNPSQKLDILGNTNISRILKVGGIAQNEGEIKLQVYCAGSTNSANNLVAIFKHPNDSQGIGITYDSIIALGTSDTNATQPINIKSKGDASIFLNTNSTDRLTILGNGNVGIGITNPSYKCHIKTITDNIASGLHLDADDTGSNPNKYALTIWPSLTGGQVGWKFRTQNSVSGGVNTPLEFTNTGSIRFKKDIWHSDSDGNARLYFNNAERTYIRGQGTTPIEFRNGDDATIATFSSTGNLNITGSELYVGPDSGSSRIFLGGGAAGDTGYNHSVIESRNYSSTENTELLLFKGNDIGSPDSADRIRLRAGAIVFDTYPGASVDRAASNIRMVINGSGNIGVGTLTPLSGNKFHVEGNTYLNGDTSINGSLVVNSNLIVHGETTRLNTDVYTTERLELINAGSSTSFILRQTASGNTNNILNVINSATSNVFNITSAGNIGIGTNNPNANLHLHGNAASQNIRISFTDNTSGVATTDGFCIGKDTLQVGYIYNTESNAISIGTHNTERIRILADGNVGIGTNNIAYKLHIKCIYDNIASGLHLDASDASPPNQYGLTIYPYVIGAGQVGWKFRTQSQTGGTNTPLTLNHAGNITMAGNVGIGTNAPQHLLSLHVNNTTDTGRITFTNNNTGTAYDKGFMIGLHSTKDVFIWNTENSAIQFGTSGEERMRILGTGNIGIGTTNPGYKLDIQGGAAQTLRILDTRTAGDAIVALKEFNDNNGFDMAYLGSTDDRFYIRGFNNSGTPRVDLAIDRITSNVGIGMTNPKYKLDVAGTINASNILINGATVTANSLQWITSSSNIYTSNLSGNVGIGTTTPQSKLTINPIVSVNNFFNHSEAPLTITNQTPTSSTVINDPKSVLHLCREGTQGQAFGAKATFKLCRYENSFPNSRSRLDITLAHNEYDDINTMSITSGGNVGIGTTAPNSVLDIVRTSASGVAVDMLNTRFDNNWGLKVQQNYVGAGDIRYNLIHRYNAIDYNSLTFKGSNVGIGTTNPLSLLDINTTSYTGAILTLDAGIINATTQMPRSIGKPLMKLGKTSYSTTAGDYYGIGFGYSPLPTDFNCAEIGVLITSVSGAETGDIVFSTRPNTTNVAPTERMRITSDGNVGIGTTNPTSKLHITTTSSTNLLDFRNVDIFGIYATSLGIGSRGNTLDFLARDYNNGNGVATRNILSLRPEGNVGIGTTNPQRPLHIQTSLRIGGSGPVIDFGDDFNNQIYRVDTTNELRFTTNAVDRLVINPSGNIGIGTTNPGYKLDIQGGAVQTLRILDTRTAGDAIVALKEFNDNNGFDMAYIGSTDDRFYIRGYNNSSTPRVDLAIDRITSNVGIGMTNPKYKLDVAGTINASNILINGSIISASSSQWITSGTNIYANNLLGNVGIGTNNPSAYTLQVNGTIGASGNITASYSDERLKNITEYVRDVLPILSKINVFKYNCNDLAASYGYDKNKKEIGLSAQEVQKYYPEVVSIAPFDSEYDEEKKNITSKSSKNYLTLDYERLVPILLQGIKDLNNKVVEMEENEIHMKNELNNIKSRLDKLELI